MTIAHKMTYHSLYRFEKRGLLSCSVVGVAVEDWSHDELVENVRSSILAAGEKIDEPVLKRLASRLSYVECWRSCSRSSTLRRRCWPTSPGRGVPRRPMHSLPTSAGGTPLGWAPDPGVMLSVRDH